MTRKGSLLGISILVAVVSIGPISISAQKVGKICGDPTMACRGSEQFDVWEMRFVIPKNAVIYESEPFYAVILQSVKVKNSDDCASVISEDERLKTQALFPRNKVFAMKCFEPGSLSYSNVANDVGFLAVFGGKTLSQAKAFLLKVKASGKFPGAVIRRTHAIVNGT